MGKTLVLLFLNCKSVLVCVRVCVYKGSGLGVSGRSFVCVVICSVRSGFALGHCRELTTRIKA